MFKITIFKILFTFLAVLHYGNQSKGFELFLPSIINIKPEIFRRSGHNEDTNTDLIDLKNITFNVFPQFCGECQNDLLLIIAIQSYVANFERRQIIRDTWGKKSNCIQTIFFVGTTYDNSVMKHLNKEIIANNDMVQGNIEDTFKSLPYKHIMALKWIHKHCKSAKFVVKTDGDTIIRVDKLYKLLQNNTWGSEGLIAGYVERKEAVLRTHPLDSKNIRVVSKKEYQGKFYPPYCWGQFVLYSADVVHRLLERSRSVPYFKIEDIYVTGLLARNLSGIRHVNLVPRWYLSRAMVRNYSNELQDYVYGPYSLAADEMKDTWETIASRDSSIDTPAPLELKYRKSFNSFTV